DGNVIGHVVDIKKNHLLFDDDGKIIGSMDKAGRVFDNNGKHLFTVSPDDKLYDPNGNLIGSIDENGNILDLNGNIIGNATNLPHYLYDANGNIIGYIKDNKIFDNEGNQIGWIDADGNIYDMDGNLIGKINPDGSVEWFNENGVCANAKYNGEVRDANGELLYKIKCGKIYDKYGNLIGTID
ncbi:MAG: 5-fold beta-flower protein, partial [Alphaproteobacteria bacterium]